MSGIHRRSPETRVNRYGIIAETSGMFQTTQAFRRIIKEVIGALFTILTHIRLLCLTSLTVTEVQIYQHIVDVFNFLIIKVEVVVYCIGDNVAWKYLKLNVSASSLSNKRQVFECASALRHLYLLLSNDICILLHRLDYQIPNMLIKRIRITFHNHCWLLILPRLRLLQWFLLRKVFHSPPHIECTTPISLCTDNSQC